MIEPENRGGKARDASRTRAVILNAAEMVFAQHGFDGARIEVIARTSGYNNGLLFRYFGDKLGLYTEVLKRADREMGELLARVFAPLLMDETIVLDAQRFKGFLRNTCDAFFAYMVEHPHIMRMLNWEQAEGWQTFAQISSQFAPGDLTQLEALFSKARQAGLLRPNLDVAVIVVLIGQLCWSSPAALPLYQSLLASKNVSTASILTLVQEQISDILVAGIMNDADSENISTS